MQDASHARLDQLDGLLIAHAGRHNQNPAAKTESAGAREEVDGAGVAEIDIEQHHVGAGRDDQIEALGGGGGLSHHQEARLIFQHARHAFAEHGVVVDE